MDPREKLARSVQRSMRQFDAEMDLLEQAGAAQLKLSRTDTRALEIIERHPDGVTPGELAGDLGFTPSAATAVINRLEAAGMAERTLSPTDRRSLTIRPTAKGRAVVQRFLREFGEQVGEVLDEMSDQDLLAIERFLSHVGSRAAAYRTGLKGAGRPRVERSQPGRKDA